jgi:hypothetical protein
MFSADSLLSSLKTNTSSPASTHPVKKEKRAASLSAKQPISQELATQSRGDPKQISLHNAHIPPPSAALGRIHLTQIQSVTPAKYLGDVLDARSDDLNKVIHALSLTTESVPVEEGGDAIPEVFWGVFLLYFN